MANLSEKFGKILNTMESRLSLWNLLNGGVLMTSIGLPAWAVNTMGFFGEYSPLSWILAGFAGALFWALVRIVWVWGKRVAVQAKYDAKILERADIINPIDLTFEGKRIFINDLVLPSHPYIADKTFINCELIGPANIYFLANNTASPIRPPRIDGVWLGPTAGFNVANAFTFSNCIFRGCSFQRITIFAGLENYEMWKDNPNVNWISVPPSEEQVEQRRRTITPLPEFGQPETPQLEAPREENEQ